MAINTCKSSPNSIPDLGCLSSCPRAELLALEGTGAARVPGLALAIKYQSRESKKVTECWDDTLSSTLTVLNVTVTYDYRLKE